jgi:hypothetical protein
MQPVGLSCIEQTYSPYNCDDRFDGFHFAPLLKRTRARESKRNLDAVWPDRAGRPVKKRADITDKVSD